MGLEELESSLAAALHVPIAGRRRGDRNHVKHLPGYWPYKNLGGGASRASADQLVPALLLNCLWWLSTSWSGLHLEMSFLSILAMTLRE